MDVHESKKKSIHNHTYPPYSLSLSLTHTHTHIHIHTRRHIYTHLLISRKERHWNRYIYARAWALSNNTFIYIYVVVVVGNGSQGQPEGSLFNSYYIELYGRVLLLSLERSTLPLIRTLYRWVLSKEISSTILKSLVWLDLGLNPGEKRTQHHFNHRNKFDIWIMIAWVSNLSCNILFS